MNKIPPKVGIFLFLYKIMSVFMKLVKNKLFILDMDVLMTLIMDIK